MTVDRLLATMIEEGLHPGGQLAVRRDGELVYEWAGGLAEPEGAAVTNETLFQIRSVTKALTTMVMLLLYERGHFQFDDPVATHWPDFGRNGKRHITIAHVMSHSAGVPDGPPIRARDMADRDAVRSAIEDMMPIWEPGTANGYHASSMGWVLDELVWRWVSQDTATVLEEDILTPLGIDDVYLGLPEIEYPRMAKMVVDPEERARRPGRAAFSDFVNTQAGIALPLNWVMAVATARGLARLFDVLALGGTVGGQQLFRPETLKLAALPRNTAGVEDRRLRHPVRWGLGFILGDTPDVYGTGPHPRAIGHAGGGASVAWADPEHRISVAFLCNRMLGPESWARYHRVGDAVYGLVDAP